MIQDLIRYIRENHLDEKAIKDFWTAFNNWRQEFPKDYSKKFKKITPEDLNVFVHTIGLRSSQWPECNYSHVTISILIYNQNTQCGKYTVWYSLGEPIDDDDFLEI